MNYTTTSRWLAVGWTLVMLVGCLTPHDQVPDELTTWNDKSLHVAIFVPFAGLWMMAGSRQSRVLLAGIAFGGLIEFLQYVLPINRSADWLDFLADGIGTVLGIGLAWGFQRVVNR